jgi:hypothetical protein
MTDLAQEYLIQPDATRPPRPTLEIVRNEPVTAATSDVSAASPATEEPDIERSAIIGAVVGFFAVMIAITVGGTLGGVEPGSAFGMGVFAGFWGGGGFGFMMGATIPLARHLDVVRAAGPTHHGPGNAQRLCSSVTPTRTPTTGNTGNRPGSRD